MISVLKEGFNIPYRHNAFILTKLQNNFISFSVDCNELMKSYG